MRVPALVRSPLAWSLAVFALSPACRCGNSSDGSDTAVAIPTAPPPSPPPTLPPPSAPAHLEVPAPAVLVLTTLRTDLARGAAGIAPHLANEVSLDTPTRMTGPDPERTVAYLRRFPDVLVALALGIDRGCAGVESEEPAQAPRITCPAEALDDDYRGVSLELAEQPGHGWRVVSLSAGR